MTAFAKAIDNQSARTLNGMKARKSTANACVDLFFKVGASRGKDITKEFTAAYVEDPQLATRIALWARDVRGGAGERKLFRDMLQLVEQKDEDLAIAMVMRIPELGRWDDMFAPKKEQVRDFAFRMIVDALMAKDGLCAKWMPRKGPNAVELRKFMGVTPKFYRKMLVNASNTVEQKMCAKDWNDINFSHVPSVASARYKKAFFKNAPEAYQDYLNSLEKGEAKVNAGAVYPYDVIKDISYNSTDKLVQAQWDALPNFVGEANVFPMVDTSGSMGCTVGNGKSDLRCIDVAVSLGLYLADKNTGKFKDCFLTFSSTPEIVKLRGGILDKVQQMRRSHWGMSTDLHAAFDKMLNVAVEGNVPASEMPETLVIFSDMQFNYCTTFDDSAIQMIERKYKAAGYEVPKIVFWNLNAHDNTPVEFNKQGVALVSGFSPSMMKSILSGKDFTPEGIMLETVMNPRYDI